MKTLMIQKMMEFSKPKVSIDLDEYTILKQTVEEMEASHTELVLDVHRGLITGLLQYAERVPGFNLDPLIKQVKDTLNKASEINIKEIVVTHKELDSFIELLVKYKNQDGSDKSTISSLS